jgi:TetR/AcrR family transcriptional repressor of nem operon
MARAATQQPDLGPGMTRKGQATRHRIVAEAAALMYERGVAGTSTEDVQRAAGVSASQIYYYFTSKKALVQAVIAYQTDAVLAVHAPMLTRLDSIDALEAWRDLVVSLCRERRNQQGCPIGSLSSELASTDPDARADLLASFTRWEHAIRDGLRAMRRRGQLPAAADPDRLALALLAALQGGLLLTQARRDTTALETALDTIIDTIRHPGGDQPA